MGLAFVASAPTLAAPSSSKMAAFKTAAGTLDCVQGACRLILEGEAPEDNNPFTQHRIKLTKRGPDYVLNCLEPQSEDPSPCSIAPLGAKAKQSTPEQITGTALQAPGDNCLYASGAYYESESVDYTVTVKYCADKSGAIVRQSPALTPVQKKTTTNEAISLRALPDAKEKVFHTIPANSPVTVLARDKSWFLVSDAHGMLGWAHPTVNSCYNDEEKSSIAGICYRGC